MRCSWIEKNRGRNIIDWERTKNDVISVVSLCSRDLVHTSTSGGKRWLGGEYLRGWLATTIGVTSGTGWSILILVLILGTLTRVVTCLATLVAGSKDSTGSWVARWSWVERGWRARRHKGWPRWVVLAEHAVQDPDSALLRARTGGTVITGMLAEISGSVHVLCLDGLVDKDLEGGKVMKIKLTAEPSVESSTEPFLLVGVDGDLFSCITGQPVELTAVLVNRPSALSEVA